MKIEIKKSIKPVNYLDALKFLERRVAEINKNEANELIWLLEHPSTFTAGTSFNKSDILDKSIDIIKTSRGGKITWHGPGQLICYLAINLNNRNKDIRKFLNIIENSIILSLKSFGIQSYSDRKNIGIWTKINNKEKKVAAIGIKVKKWITYHGFSININNDISNYKKIIPCGIKNKDVTTLKEINNQNYNDLSVEIIKNLINNLKT
jgi:lipoyl(octanoyl) transferase|tara:strand:- start:2618 stop:3238 length:621 start_codon:yes stop_codon:yes gene_type:complete